MQQRKRTLRTTLSRWRYLAPLGLAALIVLFVVQQASAGPITNPGGAPYAKLSVYQGVLSIVPNGPGDSVMEIGNAGRDIKSTGDINITPNGDVHVTTGRLCFGSGTSSCSNTWGAATTWTLDAVLAAGNSTSRSAAVGAVVTPMSKLAVNNGTSGTGGVGDSITSYGNTRCIGGVKDGQVCSWDTDCYTWPSPYVQCVGSALYAEQANNNQNSGASGPTATHDGYAGYFSGRVLVRPAGVTPLQYNGYDWARYYSGTTMTIQGNVPFWNGESLYVFNQNVNGLAARIFGGVEIGAGATSLISHGDPQAALTVYNDGASTLYGNNGLVVKTSDGKSSVGASITAGAPPAGGTAYGLVVGTGGGYSDPAKDIYDIYSLGGSYLRSLAVGFSWTGFKIHPKDGYLVAGSNVGFGTQDPRSRLVVSRNYNGGSIESNIELGQGQADDAITSYANSPGSAIHGLQQAAAGYSGLFEGKLGQRAYGNVQTPASVLSTVTSAAGVTCSTSCSAPGLTCVGAFASGAAVACSNSTGARDCFCK